MNENFALELDRYEREVAKGSGALAAAEARREMAAHLDADFAARLEIGLSPEEARRGALQAIGDLNIAAREESLAGSGGPAWARWTPVAALTLVQAGWALPALRQGGSGLLFTSILAAWTIAAIDVLRRSDPLADSPFRNPRLWGTAAILMVTTFVGDLDPLLRSLRFVLVVGSVGLTPQFAAFLVAIGLAFGVAAKRRRAHVTWTVALANALFLSERAGLFFSGEDLSQATHLPLAGALGSWLTTTLFLLTTALAGAGMAKAFGSRAARQVEAVR